MVCKEGAIGILGGGILEMPEHTGPCSGCAKCVLACPALAITLVDRSGKKIPPGKARVQIPLELLVDFKVGDTVRAVGAKGEDICEATVVRMSAKKMPKLGEAPHPVPSGMSVTGFAELIQKKTLITLEVDAEFAVKIAGIRIQDEALTRAIETVLPP